MHESMKSPFETRAKIIADTVSAQGVRITTFEVEAPRYLLAEINTHRVIARSAASSRAIPIEKRIRMVEDHPYVPAVFGRNKPGMQSDEALDGTEAYQANAFWMQARDSAVESAKRLKAVGVHKQQANRILEPFCGYTGVMTGTEWDNFFKLRAHAEADPGFEILATKMRDLYETSTPRENGVHLPYVDDVTLDELDGCVESAMQVASARCARVSYKTFDGKTSTLDKDVELCERLISSGHFSPFDHVGYADTTETRTDGTYWSNPRSHRHFYGWIPFRVYIERSQGIVCARDSFASIESYR